jgi:hypothetical protein
MKKLAFLTMLAACGGGGDATPDANPCPNGCTLAGRTTVKWTFDAYPDLGFNMDSCTDFNVGDVSVELVDANGASITNAASCGNGQLVLSGINPGDYTVHLMPLDTSGTPLLTAPVTSMVTAGQPGDNREVTVNVPSESWTARDTTTGTFLFRISWGGLSCDATTIKNQTVKLTVDGVVQDITTDDGQMLNGADKKPCKKLSDQFPQSALDTKFGLATIEISGYDAADAMTYTHTFDTFVGAGIANPTLTFDVPTN